MQSHSTNLARHLAAVGVDVEVFYPRSPDLSAKDVAARAGLESDRIRLTPVDWPKVRRFPGHYVSELWQYSKNVRALLVQRRGLNGIYIQGLCGLAVVTGKRAELPPVAVNLHGLEMFQRSPSLKSSLQQLLLRPSAKMSALNADHSVSLGRGISKILSSLGVPPSKIAEIPVGIDDDWVVDLPRPVHRPRRFVFVGRHERRKGVAELSDAVATLRRSHEFEFDFVGPIPVKHQIDASGIKYWGSVSDRKQLREILDGCDVIVCPSYAEGMPTVILEGMSRGLAIIATDVGAVDELVDADNGWLIEAANQAQLHTAIESCLSVTDDDLYKRKVASLSRMGGKFTWERVARATAAIFETRTG